MPAVVTLQRRSDFLRAAQAGRLPTGSFLVQGRRRAEDEGTAAIRVGFTASKKTGNAVVRNRAKRRLRALARALIPAEGRAGWDYVLVARPGATVARPFAAMRDDLSRALRQLHARADAGPLRSPPADRTGP